MSSKHLAAVTLFAAISATVLLAMASAPAEAALPFSHPATVTRDAAHVATAPTVIAEVQARDASPHLIGHPASPRWAVPHANAEHPAIQARARLATLDANTFIVQPPTSVTWTVAPAAAIGTASAISTAAR